MTLFLLLIEIVLASQLYLPFSPTVVSSNEAFNSYNNADDILPNLVVNVDNYNYSVQGQTLQIMAQRDMDSDVSLYDVLQVVNVPLRRDLNLKYSIYVSTLDLNSSAIRVYISLTNTSHVLILGYHVGRLEADRIPEPSAPTYMYAFYQIGNQTDVWIDGERNISQDIQAKGIILQEENWVITRLHLGFWSSEKGSENSSAGKFNLTETTLFYETLTNVQLTSTSPRFSWLILALMVFDLLLVIVILFIGRRLESKGLAQ